MAFKPGQSGNPNGRPKGAPNKATADVREVAQQYTGQAIQTLVQIATAGESEAARVAAANAILDRAHGKPAQAVNVGGGETPIETVMRWAQLPSEATQDPSAK